MKEFSYIFVCLTSEATKTVSAFEKTVLKDSSLDKRHSTSCDCNHDETELGVYEVIGEQKIFSSSALEKVMVMN